MMVDAISVVSLITKWIAQVIESHDSSAWRSRQSSSMKLKSFNNSPIKNLETQYCDVQSNGGKAEVSILLKSQIHIEQSFEETCSSFGTGVVSTVLQFKGY